MASALADLAGYNLVVDWQDKGYGETEEGQRGPSIIPMVL